MEKKMQWNQVKQYAMKPIEYIEQNKSETKKKILSRYAWSRM